MAMPEFFTQVSNLVNNQPDIAKMGFLTSLFKVRPDSFTDADKLNLDMVRGGNDVAPAVLSLDTGAVTIANDQYGTMEVPFPVHSLEEPVPIAKLMRRMPGENSYLYDKVNWYGRLASLLTDSIRRQTDMIKVAMELQAAQVLQTGKTTLLDEKGNVVFPLDYQVPATHFPTVTKSWSDTAADPLQDLEALDDTIRIDGNTSVANIVFDPKSWDNFVKNSWVQTNLRKDGMNTAALEPELREKGVAYFGWINYNAKRYELWGYDARYSPFGQKNVSNKYLGDNKVIMLPDFKAVDFRRYFGGIPSINPGGVFEPLFGEPLVIGGEYDIRVRVRFDDKQETYVAGTKSRPLMVPAAVKQFGCLTTIAA